MASYVGSDSELHRDSEPHVHPSEQIAAMLQTLAALPPH